MVLKSSCSIEKIWKIVFEHVWELWAKQTHFYVSLSLCGTKTSF